MDKESKKSLAYSAIFIALAFLIVWATRQYAVRDYIAALWYQPDEKVAMIEERLSLTGVGERIFAATEPRLLGAEEFNEKCQSRNVDVATLGCYAGGKIYIYEITASGIEDANLVTAAHELLHAVWERKSGEERALLSEVLAQVWRENAEWFEDELVTYETDAQRIEEVWTRAGTKMEKLPEELEQNYAEYFRERAVIVRAFQNYQAPFKELEAKNAQLETSIKNLRKEIAASRAEYERRSGVLAETIRKFNACAETAGCFTETSFNRERAAITEEELMLEELRGEVNEKIDRVNVLVQEYANNQRAIGDLNDAMNSNKEERIEND